ncbi:cell wall hydrolase [Bradyrhizobium sp. WD16]|uniref:cell wall hydrolase n=1 Tax=Bradyrhizobium sp. WD16 TaxID=1521768 RepID=UPI0020A581F7|nr:cell wall hydrolase [Bradyrhizobium sp. WD16]UTD25815.1 cell wall hydrolase [Bradyrhizobium sp. WD16]
MTVLRNEPRGARFAPFGLSLCLFAMLPSEIGYQDLAALLARQPGVAQRSMQHLATTFTTIKVAAFSFPRPIGTSIPLAPAYRLASLDSEGSGITGAITRGPFGDEARALRPSDFPVVDRTSKGDRLPLYVEPAPDAATSAEQPATSPIAGAKSADAATLEPLDEELQNALQAPPLPQYDVALSLESHPAAAAKQAAVAAEAAEPADGFSMKTASLYFGNGAMGAASGGLERWQPGEEPIVVMPGAPADGDLKANAGKSERPGDAKEGESIAGKGQVSEQPKRQKTPAERLGLDVKARAKAEKCLAEAVYFEARGEAVRGQIAVAQVVMNRVFSGFYPTTVCGVVYQNKNRHLACQFTFACDDVADVVREPDMWLRAKKIAKATLDGQLWLPEVAKSTHYHAYWVRPSWVHEMRKMYRTGVHTFYRPRAWGDGSDAPSWSNPAETAAISAKL